jgi:hypothetical protein
MCYPGFFKTFVYQMQLVPLQRGARVRPAGRGGGGDGGAKDSDDRHRRGRRHQRPGGAVQFNPVDPQRPKAHGFNPLKLKCDLLVSKFAFKFNFYRYSQVLVYHDLLAGLYTLNAGG